MLASGYQWKDENGQNINMEFANGGSNATFADEAQSVMLGAGMVPFNSTGIGYDIHQGLFYIVWSNVKIGTIIIPPTISCITIHEGIEWGEINCTSSCTDAWFMSIRENNTNDYSIIYDTRNLSQRQFIALKEDTDYIVEINCSDVSINSTLRTKSSGGWNILIALFWFAFCLAVLLMIIGFYLSNQPMLAISGFLWITVGLYFYIYGWSGTNNMVTLAIGTVCVALGGYFLIMSTLSMIEGDDEGY